MKAYALSEGKGIGGVAFSAEAQCLDALKEEEGREGVHRGPKVAHDIETALDGEDGVPKAFDETHPVVPLCRLGERRELSRLGPIELP